MKKCEFSEKNYEILFIHEVLNKVKDVDVFSPSQVAEKQVGYDDLFLTKQRRKLLAFQFKICKEYKTNPPSLNKNSRCFKFDLHFDRKTRKYAQHNALVLKNKECFACYVVPYFNSYADLFTYSNSANLIDNSLMLVPLKEINDDKSHYVNFDNTIAYQHSKEAFKMKISKFDELIKECEEITKEEFEKIINTRFKSDYKAICILI